MSRQKLVALGRLQGAAGSATQCGESRPPARLYAHLGKLVKEVFWASDYYHELFECDRDTELDMASAAPAA